MATYTAEALLFRGTGGDRAVFVDSRPVTITSDTTTFTVGDGDLTPTAVFRDDRNGREVEVAEVSFTELSYPDGGRGVYGGVFTTDGLIYAILAEGAPLPVLPNLAEDIDAFFARIGVGERALDNSGGPYAVGRTLSFDAIAGLNPVDTGPPPPRDGSFASGNPGIDGLYDEQEIALLYEVAFARQPDLPGLNFWINKVYGEDGFSVVQIAEAFYFIDAFEQALGRDPDTFSDAEIVEALYANVLDRPGLASQNDPAGYQFWLGAVQGGLSRPELIREFAVSAENVANAAYVNDLAQQADGGWVF